MGISCSCCVPALSNDHTQLGNRGAPLQLNPARIAPIQLLKNVAILGSGTALAQVVNIVATPALAYLYDPDSFGLMAVFMGIVLVAGSMASLTYDSAIVPPKDSDESFSLFIISNILSLASSFLLLCIMTVVYWHGISDFTIPHWSLVVLTPLGVFSLSLFNACTSWCIRLGAYKQISAAVLTRSVSATCIQILSGFLGMATLGLIAGRIGGQFLATIYITLYSGLPSSWHGKFEFNQLRMIAFRYYRFPVFKAPQQALVLISEQLPAFALAAFFGAGFAGLYWLSDRILKVPCTVLSDAAAKVFFSECTKKHHAGKSLVPITVKTVASLSSLALLPSIVIIVYAPSLFSLLGPEWKGASSYTSWMMVWVFFRFSCSPIMAIFIIINEQKTLLNIDTIAMFLRISLILVVPVFWSHYVLVMAICIFESLKIIWTVGHIGWILKTRDRPLEIGE